MPNICVWLLNWLNHVSSFFMVTINSWSRWTNPYFWWAKYNVHHWIICLIMFRIIFSCWSTSISVLLGLWFSSLTCKTASDPHLACSTDSRCSLGLGCASSWQFQQAPKRFSRHGGGLPKWNVQKDTPKMEDRSLGRTFRISLPTGSATPPVSQHLTTAVEAEAFRSRGPLEGSLHPTKVAGACAVNFSTHCQHQRQVIRDPERSVNVQWTFRKGTEFAICPSKPAVQTDGFSFSVPKRWLVYLRCKRNTSEFMRVSYQEDPGRVHLV